ncbi:GLPGLI family protein [soil metagenome]
MKYIITCFSILLLNIGNLSAQQFISKGTIEFEVITNVKKTMGNDPFWEQLKDQIPTFKTAYYTYTFSDNKSIYKFDRYDEKKAKVPEFLRSGEEQLEWYNDFNTGQNIVQKAKWGSVFNVKDSIQHIQWKISNESRVIAGFNCRKAVGKILDSVYVFAFYTDEITVSGGPCSINGLPGMVLGVTIPRMYVSMLATKLSVNSVDVNSIKPTSVKKYYTNKELKSLLAQRIKDDTANQEDNEDRRNWINQMLWGILL